MKCSFPKHDTPKHNLQIGIDIVNSFLGMELITFWKRALHILFFASMIIPILAGCFCGVGVKIGNIKFKNPYAVTLSTPTCLCRSLSVVSLDYDYYTSYSFRFSTRSTVKRR